MADSATPVEALRLLIEEELVQVPYRPHALLMATAKANAFQTEIKWNANVGGAAIQGRAVTADASTTDKDTTENATLAIGARVLGHGFSVAINDIQQARVAGVGALRNLFSHHVRNAMDIIPEELNKKLFVGIGDAGSHGVHGLESVIANVSYAGIATGTYAEWSSTVNINGGTPRALTKNLLDTIDTALVKRGVQFTHLWTTPELIKKYEDLFNTERSLLVNQLNGVADVGFSGHAYRGRPIMIDINCPANTIYFVDMRSALVWTFDNSGVVNAAVTEAQKTMGLNFLVAELPSNNPHALKFEISLQPQFQVTQPKKVAKLGDLTQ